VRDKLLIGAVRAAYGDLIPRGRHPLLALFVTLPPAEVDALLSKVSNTPAAGSNRVGIDVMAGQVRAADGWQARFNLPARHRSMFAQGQDMVGATLQQLPEVARFEARHWARFPWMKDVARQVRDRLDAA
jgi:3-isopropylmalate/(R)-2-methylmalate dehydratase small subunit